MTRASGRRGRVVKPIKKQSGSKPRYKGERHAMKPGKRVSRTGKEYWETRQNRSDVHGSNVASR